MIFRRVKLIIFRGTKQRDIEYASANLSRLLLGRSTDISAIEFYNFFSPRVTESDATLVFVCKSAPARAAAHDEFRGLARIYTKLKS